MSVTFVCVRACVRASMVVYLTVCARVCVRAHRYSVCLCVCLCQMTDRMSKQIIYINIINGDDRTASQTYETSQMPKRFIHLLPRPRMGIKHLVFVVVIFVFLLLLRFFSLSVSLSLSIRPLFFVWVFCCSYFLLFFLSFSFVLCRSELFSGSDFISSDIANGSHYNTHSCLMAPLKRAHRNRLCDSKAMAF